jgi:hypothetical protein
MAGKLMKERKESGLEEGKVHTRLTPGEKVTGYRRCREGGEEQYP